MGISTFTSKETIFCRASKTGNGYLGEVASEKSGFGTLNNWGRPADHGRPNSIPCFLSSCRGFHKCWYSQMDGLAWNIPLKWMIWGYLCFRNPHVPYCLIAFACCFSRCIAGICCSCLWFFSGVPQEDDLLFDGAELDGFLVWLPLNVYIDDHRYGQKHREPWGKPFGAWSTYMVGFPHWFQRVSPFI